MGWTRRRLHNIRYNLWVARHWCQAHRPHVHGTLITSTAGALFWQGFHVADLTFLLLAIACEL